MKKIIGFLAVTLCVVGAFYVVQAQSAQEPLPVATCDLFTQAGPNDVLVVLVGEEQCGACRAATNRVFMPILERYKADSRVKVRKMVLTPKSPVPACLEKFDISMVPVMLVMRGGQEIWKQVGLRKDDIDATKQRIITEVDRLK
ncbi:MAG: hypothetical protein MJ053_02105 [Elusimicrobiaceae bacterium]|nr:hypothetical protein [Elusimicrobiaceae bacterium]